MTLRNFVDELEEYCSEDQYKETEDQVYLYPEKFGRLTLLEHLCEAVHPHDLTISYDGKVGIKDGNPVGGGGSISNLVQSNRNIIDREEYEERYVDEELRKIGGEDVYIIVEDQSKSQLVEALTRSLDCGYYPAGYDLQRGSEPNLIILGQPAN